MKALSIASGAALLIATAAPLAAQAADRPFLYANTAVYEEDENAVWAVENWLQHRGRDWSLTVAPEYSFDPENSLQVEMRRVLRRDDASGHELEIEYKHLFNNLQRDGWGWGLGATVDLARSAGEPLRRRAVTLLVPMTFMLGEAASDGLVHVNPALAKPRGDAWRLTGALGVEREVWRRTTLFAELARDDEGRFAQVGLRHWVQREKLAVDFAVHRAWGDEQRGTSLVLGIAWYDL